MTTNFPESKLHHSSLSDLPVDELRAYAEQSGIRVPEKAEAGELLRLIRQRQEVLLGLAREDILEICVWGRRPVKQSASKEELAKEIAGIRKMRFQGLSRQGLYALCLLRGVPVSLSDDEARLIQALRDAEGWGEYIHRKWRRVMGSMISNLLNPASDNEEAKQYQFLPEEDVPLKERIEDEGVVGGLTRKIKGAADDYVREKLDEIELRIDRKLDEIDRRLSEWRDREISNRLRIIKITLIASIIVAIISLLYDYIGDKVSAG